MKKLAKDRAVKKPKEARKVFPKKSWVKICLSVFGMLIWVGVSVIVAQLLIGKIMVLMLGAEKFVQPVWTAVYSALSYIVAMVLVIFVPRAIVIKEVIVNDGEKDGAVQHAHIFYPSSDREGLGLRGLPTWTDIGLAPVGFIAYLLLAAGLVALFGLFPWFNASETQELGFSVYVTGFDRAVAFLTLVVVAPIAEEVIFRGWLYGKLRGKLSEKISNRLSVAISILLVSVLFGIVHMQWNVGVNVFAMSVVLCGLREITGTIYSGILLHMLKNGVAFYLLYVLGGGLA